MIKDMESVAEFGYWWHTEGKDIEGKFALAVAAWEASRKSMGHPIKTVTETQYPVSVVKSEHILTINDVSYVAQKPEQDYCCQGCAFDSELDNCRVACSVSSEYCTENDTIWIKKES